MITNNDDDSGSVICLDQAVLICFLHYVWAYVYDDATDDNDDEMNEEGTLPPEHVFHLPPCISHTRNRIIPWRQKGLLTYKLDL